MQTRPRNRGRGHIKARVTAEPYIASTANSNFYSQPSSTITPKSRPSPPQITQPNVSVNNRGSAYNEYDRYSNKLNSGVSKVNVEKTSTHLFPTSSPDYQKYNNEFGVNSVAPNKQTFISSSTSAPFKNTPTTTPYPNFNSIFNTTLPASSPAPFQKASPFSYNVGNNQYSTSSSTTTFRPPTPFQVNNLNEQSRGTQGETRFYNSNFETTVTTGAPTHPTFQSRNSPAPVQNQFNNFAQRIPPSTDIPLKDIKPSTYNPGNFHRFVSTSTSSSPAPQEFQPRRFSAANNFEPTKLTPVTNQKNNAQVPSQQPLVVQPPRNNFDAQYHARQLAIAQITITTPAPVTNSNKHQSSNTVATPIYNRPSGRQGSRYTPDYTDVTTNRPTQEYQNIQRSHLQQAQQPQQQPLQQVKPQQQQQQQVQKPQQPIQHQTYHSAPDPFQTPSSAKKFSTLVPKEHLYNPTTFKPDIFNVKKNYGAFEINKQKPQSQPIVVAPVPQPQQINVRVNPSPTNTNNYVNNRFEVPQQSFRPTTTTTTTTLRPLGDDEEDDGQYRPEIYEKDLYKNKLKAKLHTKQTKHFNYYQTTTSRSNHNDDDELFNTAHSQNIAASGNELRAERARQVAANVNKLLDESSRVQSTTTQKAPVKASKGNKKDAEKDVSYDYQYYDFGNEPNSYDELIEEFGRTKVKSKN